MLFSVFTYKSCWSPLAALARRIRSGAADIAARHDEIAGEAVW